LKKRGGEPKQEEVTEKRISNVGLEGVKKPEWGGM